MSTPSERRQKTVKLQARVEPNSEYVSFVEQYRQSHHLRDRSQAILHIIDEVMLHNLQPYGEHLDFQKCKFRSEYPSKPDDFCKCRKDGWLRTITAEQCMACSLYKVISVPLMTLENFNKFIKDRKQEYEQWLDKKKTVQAEAKELEMNTKTGLLKRIKEVEENNNRISQRFITTKQELVSSETDNDYLRRQMENYPPKATEILEDRKVAQQPLSIERTIKEKETTEKVLFQTDQSKPQSPSELILCPITQDHVSVGDVCKKTCKTWMDCPYYMTIVEKKVFEK